jgi:hypothetical protein
MSYISVTIINESGKTILRTEKGEGHNNDDKSAGKSSTGYRSKQRSRAGDRIGTG